jgi:hypothetical protein
VKALLVGKLQFLLLIMFLSHGVLAGCATPHNPEALSTEEFQQIEYLANAKANQRSKSMVSLGEVGITVKGPDANIVHSIPELFRAALKKFRPTTTQKIFVSNLKIKSFTKREPFQVSYEECHNEYTSRSESYQSCSTGYGGQQHCHTQYRSVPETKRVCNTKYRNEIRDVLYQRVSGDVFKRKS